MIVFGETQILPLFMSGSFKLKGIIAQLIKFSSLQRWIKLTTPTVPRTVTDQEPDQELGFIDSAKKPLTEKVQMNGSAEWRSSV